VYDGAAVGRLRASEKARVTGVGILDRHGAGGTVPAGLEGRPAARVPKRVRIVRAPSTPVGEEAKSTGEVPSIPGQLVLEARRTLLVAPPEEDPSALEPPETVREDVRRETGQRITQLAEPAWAVEERLDQEQAPAVAHLLEGVVQGAGGTVRHACMVGEPRAGRDAEGLPTRACQL
jgi:hypothetical protein